MKVKKLIILMYFVVFLSACSSGDNLKKIAQKDVLQYTTDDCKAILMSSQEEIYSAFDVHPDQDLAGLLLEGRTLATPVMPLKNYLFQCSSNTESFLSAPDSIALYPYSLVLYGEYGTETILDGVTNGMALDDSLHEVQDTFWKGFEGGEQLPAKKWEIIDDDLVFEVYFTQSPGEPDFTLSSIHVSLLAD